MKLTNPLPTIGEAMLLVVRTTRKNLKKLSKRLAEVVNAAAVAAVGLQASGVIMALPAMVQLKVMAGITLLNMIVHRIRHPHELEEKMKADKNTRKSKTEQAKKCGCK